MSLSARADKLTAPDPNFFFMQVLADLWHPETNPRGYVNLGVAENTLLHDRFMKHMRSKLEAPGSIPPLALTYGDGYKRLKPTVARFLTRHLRPVRDITPADVFVSNGCTVAIENLSWALANPGDAILIGRPYYGSFPTDVGKRTGVELRPVAFGAGVDPMGLAGVETHRAAILAAKDRGQRVAAIILAHPHNPLGRCYPRDVLLAYMSLCQEHKIHLVSDEIYALSVFENAFDTEPAPVPFESALSIDVNGIIDPELVHVIWGMSKDFGVSGLRMGFVITQGNGPLKGALQNVFEFGWTSSLSDLVTANVLDDDEWVDSFLTDNRRLLGKHHAQVLRWAKEHGIEYAPGSNAGFFVWVNLGAAYLKNKVNDGQQQQVDLDKDVMQSLLHEKVFLADGVRFGAEEPGWFRIIFAHDTEYLELGLKRILAAVGGSGSKTIKELPYRTNGVNGKA
ncbi:ACC synthase [Purpureocillium lavendulum]|uniref:ACC synthase n=1 Tax=Purpureocillium lavendulum TaxID=1247861 RepID=A0AB34G4E5_9HYPO|nr:ACC synthase [Purpureocillium lavendulum]